MEINTSLRILKQIHNFILDKKHTEHYASKNLISLLFFFNPEKSHIQMQQRGLPKVQEQYGLICHIKCNFHPFIQLLLIERDKLKSRIILVSLPVITCEKAQRNEKRNVNSYATPMVTPQSLFTSPIAELDNISPEQVFKNLLKKLTRVEKLHSVSTYLLEPVKEIIKGKEERN